MRLSFFVLAILGGMLACCPTSSVFPAAGVDQVISEISQHKGKYVVIVLDVSGSMNDQQRLKRADEDIKRLVNEGLVPEDRVVVYSFDDSPTQVLKETVLRNDADKKIVLDRVASVSSNVRGSDIRWAHHEALKCADVSGNDHQFVVMFSDGISDSPDKSGELYDKYLKYYDPKNPTQFPDTPECRDYQRLLNKVTKGSRTSYGIGFTLGPEGPQEVSPPPPWWIKPLIILGFLIVVGVPWFLVRRARMEKKKRELEEAKARAPLSVILKNLARGSDKVFDQETPLTLRDGSFLLIGGNSWETDPPTRSLPGAETAVARIERQRLTFKVVALVPEEKAKMWVDLQEVLYSPEADSVEAAGSDTTPSGGTTIEFGNTLVIEVKDAGGVSGVVRRYELQFLTEEMAERQEDG